MDFPNAIGTGVGQVPPGAAILSARLELWSLRVDGTTSPNLDSHLKASLILDPERLGPWYEPVIQGSQIAESGVTLWRRDARLAHSRPWTSSSGGSPSCTLNSSVLGLGSASDPTVRINANASQPAGTVGALSWHSLDVTAHFTHLVRHGLSNQGWYLTRSGVHDLRYASSDHPNTNLRPRLIIDWRATGPATTNRAPVAGLVPVLRTLPGGSIGFILSATDGDGDPIEAVIAEEPASGALTRLRGTAIFSYRARPDFIGRDRLLVYWRDAVGCSAMVEVPIDVVASPGVQTLNFQEGVSPVGALQQGETLHAGTFAKSIPFSAGSTFSRQLMVLSEPTVGDNGQQVYLRFPELFGPNAGQIPPGSVIVGAELEFTVEGAAVPRSGETLFSWRRMLDPLGRNPIWRAPGIDGGLRTQWGATYDHPDESDASRPAFYWPGGNADPSRASTLVLEPEVRRGDRLRMDVREAVAAWSAGEANLGWVGRQETPGGDALRLWTELTPTATDRPKLSVSYRAPSAPPQTLRVAPHADAGVDQDVFVGSPVQLDAGASEVPQVGANPVPVVVQLWLQTSGPPVMLSDPSAADPFFLAPLAPTELTFLHAVVGANGLFAGDEVRIRVLPRSGGAPSVPSIVYAGPDRSVNELRATTLSALPVSVPAGVTSYRWMQVGGPLASNLVGRNSQRLQFQTPSVPAGGASLRFVVQMRTELGNGLIATAQDEVRVRVTNSAHLPPIAEAGPSIQVTEGEWVELDGRASRDPEGQPLLYRWRILSGPSVDLTAYVTQGGLEAGTTPFRAPATTVPRDIVIELTASDRELTATDTVTVTVLPQAPAFSGSTTNSPFAPYRDELTASEARHLLRRLGSGYNPRAVQLVRSEGLSATVAQHLDLACPTALSGLCTSHTPARVMDEALNYSAALAVPMAAPPSILHPSVDIYPQYNRRHAATIWTTLAFRSPNVLIEKMARILHGRYSVSVRDLPTGQQQWVLPHLEMFRLHAFGSYREFLVAFALDPVVLSFIDGFDSLSADPNENFAREFFELHTLGVFDPAGNRLYTQSDVEEAARAFTGWKPLCLVVDPATAPSCYPGFVPFFHDEGRKTILGQSGNFGYEEMVDLVLGWQQGVPASRWLAIRLVESFLDDQAPQGLVDALAAVVRQENFELRPILRRLLRSRAMFAAENRFAVVKSPMDFATGIARTLDISLQTSDFSDFGGLARTFAEAGEDPMNPLDVDGFPTGIDWLSDQGLIARTVMVSLLSRLAVGPSTAQPGDYPGVPALAAPLLEDWLPPKHARRSAEVVATVCERLDVQLSRTPAVGTAISEFDLAVQYLDQRALFDPANPESYRLVPAPYTGEGTEAEEKLLGLLVLLMEHPRFLRL